MKNPRIAVCVFAVLAVSAACGVNMMPSKDAWYTQHYFVMQDFERQAYKDFSPQARIEFQKIFWEARELGSKKEFEKRMDYIQKTYKRDNSQQPWNCDRARIFLLNGPPASIDYKQMDDWATNVTQGAARTNASTDRSNEDISATSAEIWTYPYNNQFVQYAFAFKPPNEWRLAPAAFAGNRFIGALETLNKEQVYGVLNLDQYQGRIEELKKIKDVK